MLKEKSDWRPDEFKIAINMAGAVSAGAYTAGVLDFLMQALEEWQAAKDHLTAEIKNPTGDPDLLVVPMHDVSIEAFTGASAGGMCAAISSVMVQKPFDHIRTGEETGTTNAFYESWVNQIDILPLLGARDLDPSKPVKSLLDSTAIDDIANDALKPSGSQAPSYVSKSLQLVLSLTNTRGVAYKLYSDPDGLEYAQYYGDYIRFQTGAAGDTADAGVNLLPLDDASSEAWHLLREAAKATGAVPLALAPRVLPRSVAEYQTPRWEPLGSPASIPTVVPDPDETTWQTVNVDGGVTDNDPFSFARDLLAQHHPANTDASKPFDLPAAAKDANCAVLTVTPFPSDSKPGGDYDPEAESAIGNMLPKVLGILIAQSRFGGESLASLMRQVSFSHFVVAPSDPDPGNPGQDPLQCSTLQAFGGFFHRGFRVHDFLLGRRNCQKFLRDHFILPNTNSVIMAGLSNAGPFADRVPLQSPLNATSDPNAPVWVQIIPLVGSAKDEVPNPDRALMPAADLQKVAAAVVKRLDGLRSRLLESAPEWVKLLTGAAFHWPFDIGLEDKIRAALEEALGSNVASNP